MLKQISLKEAVNKLLKQEKVRCLVPAGSDEWTDMQPGFLNDYLEGMIFLAEEEQEAPQPKKKELDDGKIRALKDAGWSIQKIAEKMGVSAPTISKRLKEE